VTLDIRVQTRAVIENIRDILASMEWLGRPDGSNGFLVNMNDFKAYNEEYGNISTLPVQQEQQ
jgi:2-aminomuconate deaminase